jgi:hypothetical protein
MFTPEIQKLGFKSEHYLAVAAECTKLSPRQFQRTGVEPMSVLVDVVTTVGAVGTLMMGWVQLTHQKRLELRAWAFKVWITLSILLMVGSGTWEIIKFGRSDAPLTRLDVLWLLVNIWNALVYLAVGVALAAYWTSPNRNKKTAETTDNSITQE